MAREGWRVILAGSGGQGVGVGGRILALAAVLEGLNATHTQSYGACARGGPSRSEVIIGQGGNRVSPGGRGRRAGGPDRPGLFG
jgi:Pyruvate/2-oxoacid:ferredoxin oxidoreductase gamma subunit